MPGESRNVQIETNMNKLTQNEYLLVVKAFNAGKQTFKIRIN
jgi:hypothetical protein